MGSSVRDWLSKEGFAKSLNLTEISGSSSGTAPVSMYTFIAVATSAKSRRISVSLTTIFSRVMMVTFSFSLCASALSLLEIPRPKVDGEMIPVSAMDTRACCSSLYWLRLRFGWVV